MQVISRDVLESLDLVPAAAPAIRDAYVAATDGRALLPPVGYLPLAERNADCHVKFGHIAGDSIFLVKIAAGFYDNPAKGLPSSNGLMVVISAETGRTLAVLDDGGYLTDLRTGLGGAIATLALMRKDARVIGIVGTGTQARCQMRCLAALASFSPRFVVWGRSPGQAHALAAWAGSSGLDAVAGDTAEALCAHADAIVTTTPSISPLVRSAWIRPGTHITAVGADAPGKQELEATLVARADLLVADLAEQSLDHGEFATAFRARLIGRGQVVELGQVLTGAAVRPADDAVTIADLTGLATQDIAIARVALEKLGLSDR